MVARVALRSQAATMHATVPPMEQRLLGIAARIGSATAFAAMGGLLKVTSGRGVHAAEMIFYRNAAALPVVLGWVMLGAGWRAVGTRKPGAHLTRSTIGLISMLLTFVALSLLPIAEATALTYSAPISATLLSALFLREQIGRRRWIAVLVGFAGMILVASPAGRVLPLLGVATALAASLLQGAVMITVRQISRTETTPAIVFWFTTLATAAGAMLLIPFGRSHDATTYLLLVLAGLLGGVGQIAMTSSLRLAPVSVVVPFDYIQILWATLIGWLFFAAQPGWTMLPGALLIAGSGIYTAYRERRRGQAPAQGAALTEI